MLTALALIAHTPPSWAGTIEIEEVYASSEYLRSRDYPARNIKDGKSATAWVEGESGSGVGSWLEVRFDGEHEVTQLKMWAGDWTSKTAWQRANRPAELEVRWSEGDVETWTLSDEWTPQAFLPEKPRRTDRIRIRIKSIHSGTAFPDTAISELKVFEAEPGDGIVPMGGIRASSTFEPDGEGSYGSNSLVDGIRDTFWCEGDKDGDGTGEWIEIDLGESQTLGTLKILNGMGSSSDIHKTGNIATTATLEFSDGSTQNIHLKPFFLPQRVPLQPVTTRSVKITFTGIRRGTDYNDLCISEVHFLP